ncbi:hypothetical protein FGG08_005170 [Glutinoglossum americanum]|uniref:Uncharacterized protein n=1 Tax=Glutinoglossum americanum TaxID=1670608 RepID=A0A9P8L1N9_9PEZI|nr:hypothetical protein FGG08_005170 [Glutinoglossum americanum]
MPAIRFMQNLGISESYRLVTMLPHEIENGPQTPMAGSNATMSARREITDPGGYATVGQPRRGKLSRVTERSFSGQLADFLGGEVPIQFTAGLSVEASGNRLPYLASGKPSSLNSWGRSLVLSSSGVLGLPIAGGIAEPNGDRAAYQDAASNTPIEDLTIPKHEAGRSQVVDHGLYADTLAVSSSPFKPSGGARTRSYTKGQHDSHHLGLASGEPLDAPLESKDIEGHPEVKVRDFAYATSSGRDGRTNWANFSVDSAVAIVNALKEARQMGQRPRQLTQELEALLQVGELAVVNLPKLLSLHESELKLEVGRVFTDSLDGNPALRVQLASLLVATYAAGDEKLEQSPPRAIVSSQSPLGIPRPGARRNSLHRRSPAGSGYQSLFPSSPSSQAIFSHAQAITPASHGGSMGSIFQSANRKLDFAQDEGKGIETTLTTAGDLQRAQTLALGGEVSVAVRATEQPSKVEDLSREANSPSAPVAFSALSANYVSGSLTNEEIARALLKRASLQANTGARSAPTGREVEEARILRQRPPPAPEIRHVDMPTTVRGTTPTIEEFQNAMARAVLLAKQKGIPPPDWEQLMKQEDYFFRYDPNTATDSELRKLTRIQEEDGLDPEETACPEEIFPSPGEAKAFSFGRATISTQPVQIGNISSTPVADGAEDQEVLTQAAIIHEANIAGTLEYICKQENTSPQTDADPFQGFDAWLISREQASSMAARVGRPEGEEPAKEETNFSIFGLNKDSPGETRDTPDSEKLSPIKRENRGEPGVIGYGKLADIERSNFENTQSSKSIESAATPIQAPEGFEPLLP